MIATTVGLLTWAGWNTWSVRRQESVVRNAPPPSEPMETVGAPTLGADSAQVAMIVFSDFQCSACAKLVAETLPRVVKDYVETGKVRLFFRNYPLDSVHELAGPAANAAMCAAKQDRFWPMHDLLFAANGKIGGSVPRDLAVGLGIDMGKFDSCLGPIRQFVLQDRARGLAAKISGTPTIFIGRILPSGEVQAARRITGAAPYGAVAAALQESLSPVPEAASLR